MTYTSSGKRGKGKLKKPMTMMLAEEEGENEISAGPMDDAMAQMLSSTRDVSPSGFEDEDTNAQVELISRPESMRGMMRPPTSAMMSVGGPLRTQSMRSRPRPAQQRPQTMVMMRPSLQDQEDVMEMGAPVAGDDEESVMSGAPVRVRGQSSSSFAGKSKKPSSYKSQGSSSSSGWSSGPKTVTYITHGGWGPSTSGWGWNSKPSHGWGSYSYDDDNYGWSYGGGDGWSSSDGLGEGWQPGSPGSGNPGSEGEEETPETGSEGPGETVDEVGTTEEGEDRRPASPMGRRPLSGNSAAAADSAARRPSTVSQSTPTTTARSVATRTARPAAAAGPVRNSPATTQGSRPTRPRTSDPLPEVPESSNQANAPASGSSSNGELRIGDQVISNQDGLLDEELIRTVQQIIEKFDRN